MGEFAGGFKKMEDAAFAGFVLDAGGGAQSAQFEAAVGGQVGDGRGIAGGSTGQAFAQEGCRPVPLGRFGAGPEQ